MLLNLNPFTLLLDNVNELSQQMMDALLDMSAFVNWREIDAGRGPLITLAYWQKASS